MPTLPAQHRLRLALALLAGLGPSGCDSPAGPVAPPLTTEQAVDSLVRADLPQQGPGLAVLVRLGDSVRVERGYGFTDLQQQDPVRGATVFQVGSITKQFTAAAVLRLQEQGRLSVQDDVRRFLPELDTRGHQVTLHHLLTHTSGLPEYTDLFKDDLTPVTRQQVLDSIRSRPFRFPPGEQWAYNNSGYFLLGMVIERASGRFYGAYLQEEFFGPLGMPSTSVCGTPPNPEVPWGYLLPSPGAARIRLAPTAMSLAFAAGALCSTVGDLERWQRALAGGQVLSAGSYGAMITPVRLRGGQEVPYGYGVVLGRHLGERYHFHSGAIPGFQSQLAHYPHRGLTIVVLTNQWPSSPEALERRIAARVLGGSR